MKKLILLFALSLAAWAQPAQGVITRVYEIQIKTQASTAYPSVRVLFPDGTQMYAVLDTTIFTVDRSVSPPVIRAIIPQVAPRVVEEAVRQPDGTWKLSKVPTGAVKVHRNGMSLSPIRDYVVSGQFITFVAEHAITPDEIVLVDYN